jgi:hypothetical protein
MKYLEDTLAEQCLSKTLYPNTIIHVSRKKVEGTLMTYMNELQVEVDFSDVDPLLLESSTENDAPVLVLAQADEKSKIEAKNIVLEDSSLLVTQNAGSDDGKSKTTIAGRASRFFRKKS